MRAAVHTDAFELSLQDWPDPEIRAPDDVIVRVGSVGICGSDKHDLDHFPARPQIPGHEFAGVIHEVGADAAGFKPGDRVLVRPHTRCGKCGECLKTPRGECLSPGVFGCRGVQHPPGAMAEQILVRAENLWKVPDNIPLAHAALADPLAVAIHAVERGPSVRAETCVIMGAGVIGLLLAQVLRLDGAGEVALVDVLASHLEVARGQGEFLTFSGDDREKLEGDLNALKSGIFFELAGGEAPTLDAAIQCIRPGGTVLLVSQRPGGAWINYQRVMGNELNLHGVAGVSDEAWERAVELLFSGRINAAPLITHTYPLEEATRALDTACHGDSLKVCLSPNPDLMGC
ncbi:MAG: alcohol dehydrogenase catalytic domain-containing protein [Armatimonadetes bacterium]|nr:alcohol dehydrogenase catalytic domain-containing protein [Armatimonadota bacterium]